MVCSKYLKMIRGLCICGFLGLLCLMTAACGKSEESTMETEDISDSITIETPVTDNEEIAEEEEMENTVSLETVIDEETDTEAVPVKVVIDAGHQEHANLEMEPIGPDATERKISVSGGTRGVVSRLNEYELNLQVSLKLQEELERRGYQVIMVRTTNDVDICNSERAMIANDAGADVFVRIHANGSEDPSDNGMMTICPTPDNPYCSDIYEESSLLAKLILDEMVNSTGAKRQYVWETDTMSGINWSNIPVTIIEMGYMTNKDEDRAMATEEYQEKIIMGIANGIDRYMEEIKDVL